MKKINVAIVGLDFGSSFVKIYRKHPNVEKVGLFDINTSLLEERAKTFCVDKVYSSFEEILRDSELDAVHLVTPIPLHAQHTIAVLNSGKHCACTVPMAITLEDIQNITQAVHSSGKNYMMMETALYTYHFLYAKHLLDAGELGNVQFVRGMHYQDMSCWPDYWKGFPPMLYGTHAIAPMVALAGSRIKRVNCFGSGTMPEELHTQYNNPFPIECALFEFENGLKGEATRSLFETARSCQEGFHVYGSKKSFEWGFNDRMDPYVTTLPPAEKREKHLDAFVEQTTPPNLHHTLPNEIKEFTVGNYDPKNPEESLKTAKGGGHHGSHPHLVHEFVMSILEDRKPLIDETLAGNITAAGICAHKSAMLNGESIIVPEF